jgi:aryl-alcohol dehydrogenase-like predicted oxidoreductase
VSAIGVGCATMTPFYGSPGPQEAAATVRRAAEFGIDLIDTADAYVGGRNEERIADTIAGRRDRYVIAGKFGNLRRADSSSYADGRPEYVKAACWRSLARLRPRSSTFTISITSIPTCRSRRRSGR